MSDETSTPRLGERFDDALVFAAIKHRRQVRKGSEVPYLGHLLGVCSLVIEDGGTEDEAIAALLHDVVEDQGGEPVLEEVRARFGDAVADIVLACSDTTVTPKPPWRDRKEAYLIHLLTATPSTLRVSLADKLFNARAILGDLRSVGDAVWERFNAGRDGQLWYYGALADRFAERRPGRMADELTETVRLLRREAAAAFYYEDCGTLLFAPTQMADEVQATRDALSDVYTWRDAARVLSPRRLNELREMTGAAEERPDPAEDVEIPDDWPQLRFADMASWLPAAISDRFGHGYSSMSDSGTSFEAEDLADIEHALAALGITLELAPMSLEDLFD